MFSFEIWVAYTAACILLVLAPGPDNLLAFIPQFVDPAAGSVAVQMLIYGGWFAALTAVGFSLMGVFAARLSIWLQARPRIVSGLNVGAGLTFVVTGLSVVAMKQR